MDILAPDLVERLADSEMDISRVLFIENNASRQIQSHWRDRNNPSLHFVRYRLTVGEESGVFSGKISEFLIGHEIVRVEICRKLRPGGSTITVFSQRKR